MITSDTIQTHKLIFNTRSRKQHYEMSLQQHHIEELQSSFHSDSRNAKLEMPSFQSPKSNYNLRKIKAYNSEFMATTQYITPIKHESNIDTQVSLTGKPAEEILQPARRNDQSLTISASYEEQYNESYFSRHQHCLYLEHRKSYRKHHKIPTEMISYRKYQDSMERRIVNIMNKLQQRKVSQKDLNCLAQKILKLTPRELTNKYIISGLRVIGRIASEFCQCPDLQNSLSLLDELIEKQLDETSEYNDYYLTQQPIESEQLKRKIIRKIYSILKETKKQVCNRKLQQISKQVYENELKQGNIKSIIQLIKIISK